MSVAHLLAQHPEERGRPGQLVHLIDPRTMSNVQEDKLDIFPSVVSSARPSSTEERATSPDFRDS